MKTITTSEVSRGKHKLKFDLEHTAVNTDNTNLSDALKNTAPTMFPMSTFSRVTGTMAAKNAAMTILPTYEDPNTNLLDDYKKYKGMLTGSAGSMKSTAPILGTPDYMKTWKRKYRHAQQLANKKDVVFTEQTAEQDPYAGHTGETAYGVGRWLGRANNKITDPAHRGRNLGISALLGAAGGYGVSKLTRSDHPAVYSVLGALLTSYLNAKSTNATAAGTPWLKTAKAERGTMLEEIATKQSGAILDADVHGSLKRLVARSAELDEGTRQELLSAIQGKSEWELLALLKRIGGGLAGGGIVAFLASMLLGKKARIPGAIAGYLLGNLMHNQSDPYANLNMYGRSY